jgi:hypothetical protein
MKASAISSLPLDRTYWSYADLSRELGLSIDALKRRMAGWAENGFPAPCPWSRREKRWNAAAVRRWIEAEERRAGALGGPELQVIQGGRP